MDRASLDRFALVEINYSPRIEKALAKEKKDLIDFAHAFRETVDKIHIDCLFSYRTLERIAELEKQEDENTYKSDNKSRYSTVGSVWRKYDDEFDSDEVYHAALFLVSNGKVKLMDIMDANRWYDEEYDLHGDDNKLKDMLSSRGWTYVGQMEDVVTINVK